MFAKDYQKKNQTAINAINAIIGRFIKQSVGKKYYDM